MTAPRTYPHGVPSWVDTEQSDVEAAKRFYGAVFGWTFVQASPPAAPFRYLIAQLDGQDVCGLGDPAAGGDAFTGVTRWNTYVAVDDAHAAATAFESAGGTVTAPPTPGGEGGVSVAGLDPGGHEIRVWQAKRRLGAQVVNAPGAWNFSDLHLADLDVVRAFYTGLFGWEFSDVGFATMIRRPGYGDHLAATVDPGIHERQSGVGAPPGFADAIGWVAPPSDIEEPGWHVTFSVADRDATAARVAEQGGAVLATDDTSWTRTAMVRDPQGAVFTASQFMR
jgi:predicted enzyme related to lactoylglutathione lyase